MANEVFNFYQDTGYGWGWHYPDEHIWEYQPTGGFGWTPWIPHPSFPIDYFTGFYLPQGVVLGGTRGFLFPVPDKYIYQSVSISGLSIDSNKQSCSLSCQFNGYMTPLVTDSSWWSSSFPSGNVEQANTDKPFFILNLSGALSIDNIDRVSQSFSFTGGIESGLKDVIDFNCSMSGAQVSGNNERALIVLGFSGAFFPKVKDFASIDIEFSSIAYADDVQYEKLVTDDSASVGVTFNIIVYENA